MELLIKKRQRHEELLRKALEDAEKICENAVKDIETDREPSQTEEVSAKGGDEKGNSSLSKHKLDETIDSKVRVEDSNVPRVAENVRVPVTAEASPRANVSKKNSKFLLDFSSIDKADSRQGSKAKSGRRAVDKSDFNSTGFHIRSLQIHDGSLKSCAGDNQVRFDDLLQLSLVESTASPQSLKSNA